MPRVAIVGGGITGVAAAYQLSREGHADFTLYEASARLGGTVETVRRDGFVIECGPDSWVSEKPWARDLAIELGLESEIIPSLDAQRRTYLLMEGQLIPMPDGMRMMVPTDLEAIAHSPLFSETARQAYRREPERSQELKALAAARPPGQDESIASFVERHFGKEVVEKIAGPLLAGIFGGDIRKLSAMAVMSAFLRMEREHGSLIAALQKQQRSRNTAASVFTSLKSGLQTLIDGMVAILPPANVRLRDPVVSITQAAGRWRVATASGTDDFDAIILAIPVHITRRLLLPMGSATEELRSLLDVEATSAIVAAFAFNREQSSRLRIPEGFGFLVPQGGQTTQTQEAPQLLACTFVDQKFAHRAPDECILLRGFYGGAAAPKLLGESDEAILSLARRQLSMVLGELPVAHVTLVRRWPNSLPQYGVGHLERVARVEALTRNISGLYLTGNAFHGVGLPDLVHQGRELASHILGA